MGKNDEEELAKALTSHALSEEEIRDSIISRGGKAAGLLSAIQWVADNIEIDAPRWEYWWQVDTVELWQAIILSCNQDDVPPVFSSTRL